MTTNLIIRYIIKYFRRDNMAKRLSIFIVFLMLLSAMNPAIFQSQLLKDDSMTLAAEKKIQLEELDRGLVAVHTDEGVFLSWRLLSEEVTAYSDYGLRGTDFNVYRNGDMLATITKSTNYLDEEGKLDDTYYVVPVVDGEEQSNKSKEVSPWENQYYDLPLQKPLDGVTPAGEAYTYHANDASVGDVNDDGQYEFIVKWEPSNSKDVSQKGYTGNTYIDTYTLEGELLYRIDLGVNIRSGAHYTQFLVYDFDGDGKSELMFKTAPGTKIIQYENNQPASEEYITMPAEDIEAGYSHYDDYRMSADDYYEYVVEMFKGWHDHEEVVAGNWPATIEEALEAEGLSFDYPLSDEAARELADYFIDVYAPARSDRNELRTFEGFILTGPEYLTVFDGETGAELDTIHYKPDRHDDGLMWGDYAMARIEPGNRVDRFLAGVAYLDGVKPSAIFARGYYTRTTLVAYDFDGSKLSERWYVDSGWTPMSNPFNDGPHGTPGTSEEFGSLTTQGNHQLSTADVDGDGKQEIIYGAATIDHDGTLLYSSSDTMPEESANPGAEAGLGHGDALHVADIDPDREGLEIFSVFEGGPWAPYGFALRDAKTGEVLFGEYTGRDTGRGMIGDVIRGQRGMEVWATDLRSATGDVLQSSGPGTNMNIKWSTDMATQIINGSGDQDVTIDDFENGRMLTATGTRTNNGTKGNPSLVADIFGDWREELVVRTTDSSALRIFTNTELTNRKLFTLMHDIQYRTGIAWQNVAYNQPAYPSFYMASDIDWDRVIVPNKGELPYVEEEAPELDLSSIESLIEEAKAISNQNGTYTEDSFQHLQEAITEAENALEAIRYEHEIHTVLGKLQGAINQLEEIVDLGKGYFFDFGSEHSPLANGYTRVSDSLFYDEEIGYGFLNGTDGYRDQDGTDLLRDFILASGKEFVVDLENGEYDVRIITGSAWDANTTSYQLEDGEVKGGVPTKAGEFITYADTVEVTDGQLNITFSGEWARINGIEIVHVKDYQRKFDFGPNNGPVKYGYLPITNTTLYNEEIGYGLDKEVDSRDRGEPDPLRSDFVIHDDYEFRLDLRNGVYRIKALTGDQIASNTTTFTIEGNEYEPIRSGAAEYGVFEETIVVEDGQLNIGISQRINALEVYYIGDIPNADALEQLLSEAKEYSNEDGNYTEASFKALQTAIEAAEKVLHSAESQEEIDEAYRALQDAIDQLEEMGSEDDEDKEEEPKQPEDPEEQEVMEINDMDQVEKSNDVYMVEQQADTFVVSKTFAEQMEDATLLQLSNGKVKVLLPKALLLTGNEIKLVMKEANQSLYERFPEVLSGLIAFQLFVDGEAVTNFKDTPITLVFEVNSNDITDTRNLRTVYINDEGGMEEYIEGVWNESSNEFSTKVTHFSIYGVFEVGDDESPVPEEEETTSPEDEQDAGESSDREKEDEGMGTETENDSGSSLPSTATNLFNLLLIGFLLLIAGGSIVYISYLRKKRLSEEK